MNTDIDTEVTHTFGIYAIVNMKFAMNIKKVEDKKMTAKNFTNEGHVAYT